MSSAALHPGIYQRYGDDYLDRGVEEGGAVEDPAWYLNLKAEPEVSVQVRGDRFKAHARTASAEEKPDMWRTMAAAWPAYDDYQLNTARDIPVVVLERSGVTSGDWSSRRLHFVGIGGAGRSGLALVAHALGARVTGSDRAESSYTERLRERGIEPVIGHAAANVPDGAEVVYSTAVASDNPERLAAQGRELHRADLLAQIAAMRPCVAVTGTHGKTTTAAMIVHALRGAGLDPAYVIGGEPCATTGSNAAWGSGEWIVVEADESDRSLLKLDPDVAVLTNAELDHHATYGSRLDLEQTFKVFMSRAGEQSGRVGPSRAARCCPPGAVAYDAVGVALSASGSRFQWRGIEVALSVPGVHNAINAAGALTAASLAGADANRAAASLADFRGAKRRFELLGGDARGRRGLRRLRPPSDRGRCRDRCREDA